MTQTALFAQTFAASDRYGLTQLLCSMEKLPREKLLDVLIQWKQLLTDALLARAGIPCDPDAAALAHQRTAPALASAAQLVQQAMDHCSANVGAGHICGWLAVALFTI